MKLIHIQLFPVNTFEELGVLAYVLPPKEIHFEIQSISMGSYIAVEGIKLSSPENFEYRSEKCFH